MVQYCFRSTETRRRLVTVRTRTAQDGRHTRLSHDSSWTMSHQSAHTAPFIPFPSVRKRGPPCEYANGISTMSVSFAVRRRGHGPPVTEQHWLEVRNGQQAKDIKNKIKIKKERVYDGREGEKQTNKLSEKKDWGGRKCQSRHCRAASTRAGRNWEEMHSEQSEFRLLVLISTDFARDPWYHLRVVVSAWNHNCYCFLRIAHPRSKTFDTAHTDEPSSGPGFAVKFTAFFVVVVVVFLPHIKP